jgi:hypothetical protein
MSASSSDVTVELLDELILQKRKKLNESYAYLSKDRAQLQTEKDSKNKGSLQANIEKLRKTIQSLEEEINEDSKRKSNLAALTGKSILPSLATTSQSAKLPDEKAWRKFDLKKDAVLNDYLDEVDCIGLAYSLDSYALARIQVSKFTDVSLARVYKTWFLQQSPAPDWTSAKVWFRAHVSADRNSSERVEDFKNLSCSSTNADELACFNISFKEKAALAQMDPVSPVLIAFYEAALTDTNIAMSLASWKFAQTANNKKVTLDELMEQAVLLAGTLYRKKRKAGSAVITSSTNENQKSLITCNYCGIKGHIEKDCLKKKRKLNESKSASATTSSATSSAAASSLSSGSAANQATNLKKGDEKKDLSKVKCYGCQQFGHYKNECKEKQKEKLIFKSSPASVGKMFTVQVDARNLQMLEDREQIMRELEADEGQADKSFHINAMNVCDTEQLIVAVEDRKWNTDNGILKSDQDLKLLTRDKRPIVAVEIEFGQNHKIQVYALLDSGANRTFINQKVWRAMKDADSSLELSDVVKTILAQNNQGSAQCIMSKVKLMMLNKTPVYTKIFVHEDHAHDMILGIEDIRAAGWTLDSELRFSSEVEQHAHAVELTPIERTDAKFEVEDFTESELQARQEGLMAIRQALLRNQNAFESKVAEGKNTLFSMPDAEFDINHYQETPPAWENQFPLSAAAEEVTEIWLKKMMTKGKISLFPATEKRKFNIPIFVVKENSEKGKKARVVLNAVLLNKGVIPSSFQIPSILNMANIKPGEIVSEIDVMDAFHSIPLTTESKNKLAFTFKGQAYRYNVAALGLVNLSEHFQEVLARTLQPQKWARNYIDNIFIRTEHESNETGEQQIHKATDQAIRTIDLCTDNNIWISSEKATDDKLLCRRIRSLGMTFSPQGRGIDPLKVEELRKMKIPKTAKEAKAFVQFVSFFRSHIRHCSDLLKPFTELTKEKAKEKADSETLKIAFEQIVQAISTAPLLRTFDPALTTVCLVDASQVAIAAVLYQVHSKNPVERDFMSPSPDNFLCCASRLTRDYETDYSVVKKEALTISWVIDTFFDLIVACKNFIFVTDAMAVYYMGVNRKFDRTTANWYAKLLHVPHVTFRWIAGVRNHPPDFMSRMYYQTTWGVTNQDVERFRRHRSLVKEVVKSTSVQHAVPIIDAIIMEDTVDNVMLTKISTTRATTNAKEQSSVSNDAAIIKKNTHSATVNGVRFMYPIATKEQEDWVQQAHSARHGGVSLTMAILHSEGKKWPYMVHHVKECLDACDVCIQWKRVKPVFKPLQGQLSRFPFQVVQCDFISGLPSTTSELKELFVCICTFTSFVVLIPMKDKTSNTLAKHLFSLWALIGPPQVIQADNESCLWAEAIDKVKLLFGVLDRRIAAYSPQKNGKVERKIDDVKLLLNKLIGLHGCDWDMLIPFVQLSLNSTTTQETTIPFEMVFARPCQFYGTSLHLPSYSGVDDEDRNLVEWFHHLRKVEEFVFPAVKEQREQRQLLQKDSSLFDKFGKVIYDFPLPVGQAVRVRDPLANKPGNKSKTPVDTIGTISRQLSYDTYEVTDRSGAKMPRPIPRSHMATLNYARDSVIVSESQEKSLTVTTPTTVEPTSKGTAASTAEIASKAPARPATENRTSARLASVADGKSQAQRKESPAAIKKQTSADTEDFYKVDFIVDSAMRKSKKGGQERLFRVRWSGYGAKSDTWEPARNLPTNMVKAFISKNPQVD